MHYSSVFLQLILSRATEIAQLTLIADEAQGFPSHGLLLVLQKRSPVEGYYVGFKYGFVGNTLLIPFRAPQADAGIKVPLTNVILQHVKRLAAFITVEALV